MCRTSELFGPWLTQAYVLRILKKTVAVGGWYEWTLRSRIRFSPENISTGSVTDNTGHSMSEVFAVNVNWNADYRRWNVNANRLDDYHWNAGNRVLSSNSCVSPVLFVSGSF